MASAANSGTGGGFASAGGGSAEQVGDAVGPEDATAAGPVGGWNASTAPAADASTSGLVDSFPPAWCDRAGEGQEPLNAARRIADAYYVQTRDDCRFAELFSGLSEDQRPMWLSYLVEYTYLMTGCTLEGFFEVMGQGLSVFGPANTPIVGGARPSLGAGDVAALIELFVQLFGDELQLTAEERVILAEHLRVVAQSQIDSSAFDALSRCPDAGLDSP